MEVFVDTSGWIAWRSGDDAAHEDVLQIFADWGARGAQWVTTNCIMLELFGARGRPTGMRRELVIALYEDLRDNPGVEIVHVFPEAQERAFTTYLKRYLDKDFSLVDCTSFHVMLERKIRQVITTDPHFRQVGLGFELLLEPEYDA
jgi:predicted nucleic acid-binding protein